MTDNEFLDSMKSLNFVIYRCLDCGRRMYGGASSAHELYTGHVIVNEKSLTIDEIETLDKLSGANNG